MEMGRVSEEVQNLRQISLEHQEADRRRQMHQENRKRTERGEERSRSPLRGGLLKGALEDVVTGVLDILGGRMKPD